MFYIYRQLTRNLNDASGGMGGEEDVMEAVPDMGAMDAEF
jgi:hypothetical protein